MRLIEQYFRPGRGTLPVVHVKHCSVKVNFAPDPPPVSTVTDTGFVGITVYAPGSITARITVTLPPETVAVNFAGKVLVPPTTVNVRVPLVKPLPELLIATDCTPCGGVGNVSDAKGSAVAVFVLTPEAGNAVVEL